MPWRPDVPCARCGTLLWSGKGCLAAGERTCRACRKKEPRPYGKRAQPTRRPAYPRRSCVRCVQTYAPRSARQKYCTSRCRELATGHRAEQPRAGRATRACEVCGGSYRYTHSKQSTCGRGCGVELRRLRGNLGFRKVRAAPTCPVRYADCGHCGQVFVCRSGRKYCTDDCTRAADVLRHQERTARRAERLIDRVCDHCASPFRSGIETQRFCTRGCTKRARKRDRDRARSYGAEYVYVSRAKVYERDRWRCGLCKRRVNPRLRYPHPMSVSLDHVVPLSRGGGHTYANVQCSHLSCNVDKNADGGPSQQLALVG
jgi:HNH endonuclease